MSKTLIECRSVVLLQGFEAAIRFMGAATLTKCMAILVKEIERKTAEVVLCPVSPTSS